MAAWTLRVYNHGTEGPVLAKGSQAELEALRLSIQSLVAPFQSELDYQVPTFVVVSEEGW